MFPAFILSLSAFAGVLLDIQRHYDVKDSEIGLLQTGKRPVEVESPECTTVLDGSSQLIR